MNLAKYLIIIIIATTNLVPPYYPLYVLYIYPHVAILLFTRLTVPDDVLFL
jgi:hypothetical protein